MSETGDETWDMAKNPSGWMRCKPVALPLVIDTEYHHTGLDAASSMLLGKWLAVRGLARRSRGNHSGSGDVYALTRSSS